MKIVEVGTDTFLRSEFLQLPVRIYRNNPYWIRPLDQDIENIFDPLKNKSFKDGECCRWAVVDHSDQIVGRVAAFIDRKTVNKGNDQPTGGMGFFECANDAAVARMLFNKC